jgi:hypothetical protein
MRTAWSLFRGLVEKNSHSPHLPNVLRTGIGHNTREKAFYIPHFVPVHNEFNKESWTGALICLGNSVTQIEIRASATAAKM